jgi:hypothetical protein
MKLSNKKSLQNYLNFGKLLFVFLLISTLVLISCSNDNIPEELKCETDADCIAAECCHPTSCINTDYKTNCKDTMCTMSCEPGTLDCGQGSCLCVDNKCTAQIN